MVKNGNSQGRDIIEVLVIEFIQDYIKTNIRRDVAIIVNKTFHPLRVLNEYQELLLGT